MKSFGILLIGIIFYTLPCLAQQEDELKDFTNYSVFSDPHDTDMDESIRKLDINYKYKGMVGKTLTYEFKDFVYEVVFKSDTLIYWKNIKTGYEENDISKTLHLGPYSVVTAWVELDGSFVSLYSNFKSRTTSFFVRNAEGRYEGYSGKIKIR